MELLVFGQAGPRLLAFPPGEGRFYDWENFGMVDALRDRLEGGRLQMICVDSLDAEAWFAEGKPIAERARRHEQYDRYLAAEVVPWSESGNDDPCLITAGTSIGAYHALNFAFRYPDRVARVISLSGVWDLRWVNDGVFDDCFYFHNPFDYLAWEHDPARLAALRRLDIILAVGDEEYVHPNTERLSDLLWDKGIWHAKRIWPGMTHDWSWWQQMIRFYVDGPGK